MSYIYLDTIDTMPHQTILGMQLYIDRKEIYYINNNGLNLGRFQISKARFYLVATLKLSYRSDTIDTKRAVFLRSGFSAYKLSTRFHAF